LGLIDAWIAALGFTLQIYFDFSGLFRDGAWSGTILWHQAAGEFQFPFESKKHHRILAAAGMSV